jgi:hypothetical protein
MIIPVSSTSARRLPVYLLVDTSGSMAGDPIKQVISQLRVMIEGLRNNPYALETAHLCLITFGSTAKVEVPLQPPRRSKSPPIWTPPDPPRWARRSSSSAELAQLRLIEKHPRPRVTGSPRSSSLSMVHPPTISMLGWLSSSACDGVRALPSPLTEPMMCRCSGSEITRAPAEEHPTKPPT